MSELQGYSISCCAPMKIHPSMHAKCLRWSLQQGISTTFQSNSSNYYLTRWVLTENVETVLECSVTDSPWFIRMTGDKIRTLLDVHICLHCLHPVKHTLKLIPILDKLHIKVHYISKAEKKLSNGEISSGFLFGRFISQQPSLVSFIIICSLYV